MIDDVYLRLPGMDVSSPDVSIRSPKRVIIVYGVYINPNADWRKLIRLQLDELRRSGVLSVADLHVIVSNPFGAEGVSTFFDTVPVLIKYVEFHDENKFEYPAISHIWNLANRQTDCKYIAYFHTKGMSYARRRRNKEEKMLTHFTFSKWRRVLDIFDTRPDIHKIGLFPGSAEDKRGWIWFNFWWVRSSFVRTLAKPEDTRERYYYEKWLAASDEDGIKNHCYCILSDSDVLFAPQEALNIVRLLVWKMRYRHLYKLRNIFSARRVWPVQDFVSKAKWAYPELPASGRTEGVEGPVA